MEFKYSSRLQVARYHDLPPFNDFFFRKEVRCSYPELDSILNISKEDDNPILAFFDVIE